MRVGVIITSTGKGANRQTKQEKRRNGPGLVRIQQTWCPCVHVGARANQQQQNGEEALKVEESRLRVDIGESGFRGLQNLLIAPEVRRTI